MLIGRQVVDSRPALSFMKARMSFFFGHHRATSLHLPAYAQSEPTRLTYLTLLSAI